MHEKLRNINLSSSNNDPEAIWKSIQAIAIERSQKGKSNVETKQMYEIIKHGNADQMKEFINQKGLRSPLNSPNASLQSEPDVNSTHRFRPR